MSTDIHTIADRRRAAEALASVVGAEILTLKFKDEGRTEAFEVNRSECAATGLDDDAATRSDQESEVDQVAGDRVESGASGGSDVGHGLHDVLARIESHLVDVVANTKQPTWSEPRLVRHPNNPRITRTVRDATDGHGNVTTETLGSRVDMRTTLAADFAHDSSPVVGDAGAHSVGDVEVTPAVLRAVAGFISDSGVVYDVVRILKHLALDLEVQQKAGIR